MVKHSPQSPEEDVRSYALRILLWKFRTMQFLPGEPVGVGDIAEQLKVSRTPVHNAFAVLERQNLLVTESRKAIHVAFLSTDTIKESIWMHHVSLLGLMEELYFLSLKPKKLEHLSTLLEEQEHALTKNDFFTLLELRDSFLEHLYQLANFSSVYRLLQFGIADLYRLLSLEKSVEIWASFLSIYKKIYQGLASRNFDLTKDAVLEERIAIEELFIYAQQKYPTFFHN